jgi:predicted TIM-barrel fold metal-dependent hydrolase
VRLPAAAADHHLHIQSAEVSALLRQQYLHSKQGFDGINPALFDARSGLDALRTLDAAGIRYGVLLSEAYVFESPFAMSLTVERESLMRQENAYNVEAANRSGGRLLSFIGVNPLAASALNEVAFWAGRKGVAGAKLHLGNSDFDPQSAQHLEALATFFERAREARMAVVIHVRSPRDPQACGTSLFIDRVLSHAGDVPVQIAHAGGGGGLDESTLQALLAYSFAIQREAPGTQNLFFDLAAVGVPQHVHSTLARSLLLTLVKTMRSIGISRFVMGSDWPSVWPPAEHNAYLQNQIPLTIEEWRQLLAQKAPYWTAHT